MFIIIGVVGGAGHTHKGDDTKASAIQDMETTAATSAGDESGAPTADETTTEPPETTEPATVTEAPEPGYVTQADLGEDWPLKVKEGVLACHSGGGLNPVTFTAPDGTRYAVNSAAKAGPNEAKDIRPIWANEKKHPSLGPGLRKNIGPLLERGLALC